MKTLKTIAILSFSIFLFGRPGSGLKGTYIGNGNAFFEKLTFKPGNKVEIVFIGSTSELDYKLEDGKVKITNAGQTQVLTITDDGCLDGGGFVGKYCKE